MTVRGTRPPSLDHDTLAADLSDILDPVLHGVADGECVVVPDAHYPYHPSTGMVTNPAVVGALAAVIESRRPGVTVTVAVRSESFLDSERTARYLGYESLAGSHGIKVDSLDDAATRRVEAGAGAGTEAGGIAVPERLLDGVVLPVPSARVDGSLPLHGSLGVLASAAGVDAHDAERVAGVLRAVEPAGALVDATYTFTGDPYRASAAFAGRDVFEVERVLAELLGVDPTAVPGLPTARDSPRDPAASVTGVDVAELAAELPSGDLPASNDTSPLVRAAYRAYAGVSGDVFPPQLRGGSDR